MDIDMIEVMENNIKFVIFPKKGKVLIEGNYYPIEEEKINKLIRIISTWDSEYSGLGLDGNKFEVSIYYEGKVDRMRGMRGMPSNYEEFVNYVRSIYDRD